MNDFVSFPSFLYTHTHNMDERLFNPSGIVNWSPRVSSGSTFTLRRRCKRFCLVEGGKERKRSEPDAVGSLHSSSRTRGAKGEIDLRVVNGTLIELHCSSLQGRHSRPIIYRRAGGSILRPGNQCEGVVRRMPTDRSTTTASNISF